MRKNYILGLSIRPEVKDLWKEIAISEGLNMTECVMKYAMLGLEKYRE